jgi:hypothetical protein
MPTEITLASAALGIFILCAAFAVLRGLTRMLVGTLVFGVSAFLAFLTWQHLPDFISGLTGKARLWASFGPPILVFLTAFFLIGKILKNVSSPFGKNDDGSASKSWTKTILRLAFSILPTSVLSMVGATVVHHIGSVDEVRSYSENPNQKSVGLTQKLKTAVAQTLPESFLRLIDPHSDPARVALAKLIAAQAESPHKPVIDPKTGKPIPRAVIVENAELQSLARDGDFSTLLRHPLLTKALEDPKIQQALKGIKF